MIPGHELNEGRLPEGIGDTGWRGAKGETLGQVNSIINKIYLKINN